MKIYNWEDCIQDRYKWKKTLRRHKHSMTEVVEPEEEEGHTSRMILRLDSMVLSSNCNLKCNVNTTILRRFVHILSLN
jgi:hypothetical protein